MKAAWWLLGIVYAFAVVAHSWSGYTTGLALLTLAASALCLLDLRAGVWLFIGTQTLDAYGFFLEDPARLSVSRVVVVALVAGGALRWLRGRRAPRERPSVWDAGVLLLLGGAVVSVPFSYDVKVSLVGALQVAFLVGAYFVLSRFARTPEGLADIRLAVVATGTLSALVALGQYLIPGFPLPVIENTIATATDAASIAPRASAFFGNPNTMALLLVASALLAAAAAWSARSPRVRATYGAAAVLSIAGIGVSLSRAALVGVVVGLVLLALLLVRGGRSRLMALAALVALTALLLAIPGVGSRARSIVDFRSDASAMDRVYLSGVSVAMFQAHPLTGVGIEAFRAAYPSFPDERVTVDPVTDGHQMVFSLPAELGVLGLLSELLLAGALVVILARQLRAPGVSPYAGALAIAAAIMVMAFFNTFIFFETFWIALALVGAAWRETPGAAPAPSEV